MAWRWIDAADERAWDDALDRVGGADVYYERAYVNALADRGEGSPLLLHVEENGVEFVTAYLRRDLPFGDADGCDLATPYGYGGPLARGASPGWEDATARDPGDAFREIGAVSEFVRFHPVLETWRNADPRMTIAEISETVLWDLTPTDLRAGMSEQCRRNLRWAGKKGVRTDFANAEGAQEFGAIYRDTMRRRGAADYYLFDDAYFRRLARDFGDRMWTAF
ncbi:MAG: aminoacyltransferase, partial [Deltaproteobacteria bacterium]|nr:aminoacyltransferase [Deltaproteobacteria bacterium]